MLAFLHSYRFCSKPLGVQLWPLDAQIWESQEIYEAHGDEVVFMN